MAQELSDAHPSHDRASVARHCYQLCARSTDPGFFMSTLLIVAITILLAAANGANDNIKGAATLLGSGLASYRGAIALATIATALGGVASIFLVNGLMQAFSGKGIVPQELVGSWPFLLSAAAGAAVTVWLATWRGLPISTTHALLGGLLGAGLAMVPDAVNFSSAAGGFLVPLLVSPVIALLLAWALMPLVKRTSAALKAEAPCLCVEQEIVVDGPTLVATRNALTIATASDAHCQPAPGRTVATLASDAWADRVHYASAATVSFARGLNDTPKIAALAVAAGGLGVASSSLVVIVAMALGGWLAARRVSETLAFGITRMDQREGLTGNLVTALLVIVASRFGMPVSTTHVSTGAVFGIAARNGGGQSAMIRNIVLAWCFTLPVAALAAYTLGSFLN
jgi:PiT family inorganic phosphate transporter